jgi:hypothetical protein
VIQWVGIAQLVQWLATGWTVWGSNAVVDEIFCTCPERPWGPPSLLFNRYRVYPGGKASGAWRWQLTPSSTKVKERVELYLFPPSGPSWPGLGRPLPLLYFAFNPEINREDLCRNGSALPRIPSNRDARWKWVITYFYWRNILLLRTGQEVEWST